MNVSVPRVLFGQEAPLERTFRNKLLGLSDAEAGDEFDDLTAYGGFLFVSGRPSRRTAVHLHSCRVVIHYGSERDK